MHLQYSKNYLNNTIHIVIVLSVGLLLALFFSVSNNNQTVSIAPTTVDSLQEVITPSPPTDTTDVPSSSINNNDTMNSRTPPIEVVPAAVEYSSKPVTTDSELMAWIYPYEPACGAMREYSDGRKIDTLKPEFFTINGGSLTLLDESVVDCNGYSPAFIADLKRHSTNQFVTVSSASTEDMVSFLDQALSAPTDVETLVNFTVTNNLTGIEINFEDFGGWSVENYANFKTFVSHLGTALHAQKKQLMVVGPPIANAIEENWFLWRYEDFVHLPVDRMVVMGYDYQYDHGSSEPIAPLDWLRNVISWISARYPQNRITIALPSYGYAGKEGTQTFSLLTHEQIRMRAGYNTATRDPNSAEMTWKDDDTVYFYQDSISLAKKRDVVTGLGIRSISIWHLGGNLWFE